MGLPDSGQQRAWGSSAVTSGEGAVGPARSKGQMGSTPRERGGKICPPCNAHPGKGLCGEVGGLLPSHILGGSHEGQRDFVRHGDKVAKDIGSCPCCSCWNTEGSKESMQVVSCPENKFPSKSRHQGST